MGKGSARVTDFCSVEYQDVLLQTHKSTGMKWGGAGKSHAQTVIEFASQLQAWSILDYGCGRGTLKESLILPVTEYDPGIPGKQTLPEPADLVVCTDVLEHIEPDKLDNVIKHLRKLTRKGAFLVIALTPARQVLSDGRNAHLSLHPANWWVRKLEKAGFEVAHRSMKKGLHLWMIPRRNALSRLFKPLRIA